MENKIYEFYVVDIDGNNHSMREYKNKLLIIVNTGRLSEHID